MQTQCSFEIPEFQSLLLVTSGKYTGDFPANEWLGPFLPDFRVQMCRKKALQSKTAWK
jgi:hypothetical protein